MAEASPLRAAAWMMGALISFSTMAVATREISAELDTFQLMFYRSAIGLVLIGSIVLATARGRSRLRTSKLPLHLTRNLVHFVGQFGWFYAIALIPFVQVIALEFTTPLWVALLAPLFLREKLTWNRLAAAILGFAGVMLVLRPGVETVNTGTIAILIGAMGFAGSIMCTKRLSATDAPLTILFYMVVIQMPVAAAVAIGTGDFMLPTPRGWVFAVIVAICGMTAHFSIARALSHADVIVVAPLDFLRLPLMAVVGFLLYAEGLELWVLAGGGLILLANYANIALESRAVPPRAVVSRD